MEERNWAKVRPLYDYLDGSSLFHGTVVPADRSIANVTFRTPSPELDAEFVAGAAERGIVNVKGHRLVGGMRASCYNAVPAQAVDALLSYMADFEASHPVAPRSR
jgi:phosphoserine aminotransferase